MLVLVCGSRGWTKMGPIYQRLAELPRDSTIIHGAARGADSYAEAAAHLLGLEAVAFPADWERLGKRAGIERNLQMLSKKPDLVIAFWDGKSRGTEHMVGAARTKGIAVEVIRS